MHSQNSSKNRLEEFKRHKKYLSRIKCTSLYCPRYDMLSLSNNLLLHRNFDPKKELVPHKQSQKLNQLQKQINKSSIKTKVQSVPKANWYEQVINKEIQTQGKFNFKYQQAGYEMQTVRNQLNKFYNTSKGSFSSSKYKNQSLYDQMPKINSFLK